MGSGRLVQGDPETLAQEGCFNSLEPILFQMLQMVASHTRANGAS